MPTYKELLDRGVFDQGQEPIFTIRPDMREKNRRKHIARVMKSFCAEPEEYDKQFRQQGGCCAICRKPSDESLCIDHNHQPEPGHRRRRGLLCHACNTAIGKFKDDPMVCEQAAAYLRYWARENAL